MRPLLIDDAAREKAARVAEYAKEHVYHVPNDGAIPGNNPLHVIHLPYGFRCVFTFTREKGKTWRHLSISVEGSKYPNPIAAWTIAELFGFTGWDHKSIDVPRGWLAGMNENEHCIVILQELGA